MWSTSVATWRVIERSPQCVWIWHIGSAASLILRSRSQAPSYPRFDGLSLGGAIAAFALVCAGQRPEGTSWRHPGSRHGRGGEVGIRFWSVSKQCLGSVCENHAHNHRLSWPIRRASAGVIETGSWSSGIELDCFASAVIGRPFAHVWPKLRRGAAGWHVSLPGGWLAAANGARPSRP